MNQKKGKSIQKIRTLENPDFIEDIVNSFHDNSTHLIELTDKQKTTIEKGLEDYKENRTFTQAQLDQRLEKWLSE